MDTRLGDLVDFCGFDNLVTRFGRPSIGSLFRVLRPIHCPGPLVQVVAEYVSYQAGTEPVGTTPWD